MKAQKASLALAVSVSAAVALTGCGSGSSSSTSKDAKTLPQTSWTNVDYSKVKDGGQLTLAMQQMPDNYNNYQANGNISDVANMEAPVTPLGGAVSFNADGSWKINKDYVTDMKVTSQSPQKVEVKLNPKGVWSDGKPITYKDELSNFKAMSGQNSKFQVGSTACWEDIQSIDKGANDYDYTISFKNKNAEYPVCAYPLLPAVVTDTPTAFNTGYSQKPFPTNGPFVISNVDNSAKVITETPNPKWWGRKPKLSKIIWRDVDQASFGQSFANGEIDVLDTQANKDVLAQAQKRSDAVVQRSGGLAWAQLTFNASKAPFNDLNVRKGVAQAIDRQEFAKVTQKGLGVDPVAQGNTIYLPGQKGYQDNWDKVLPYDPKAAAKDFEKAGYKKSGQYYEKDGKPLSFSIVVPSDTPTNAQRAQLIQTFMQRVGVKVDLTTVPTQKYFSDYVTPKNFQVVTFQNVGTPFPIGITKPLFYPANSGQNFTGITDNKLGDLFKTAQGELDASKQRDDAQKVDQEIASYVPTVPFTPTPTIFVVKKGVVNVGAGQFQNLQYIDWTAAGYSK